MLIILNDVKDVPKLWWGRVDGYVIMTDAKYASLDGLVAAAVAYVDNEPAEITAAPTAISAAPGTVPDDEVDLDADGGWRSEPWFCVRCCFSRRMYHAWATKKVRREMIRGLSRYRRRKRRSRSPT